MRCTATTIFVQLTGEYLANKTQYICLIPVQHMQWAATTIFVQWTGDYCGPQDLSNICGAQLPPYLFSGLVIIVATGPVQYMQCAATTIFVQLTGEYLANTTQYICLIPVQHMRWATTTIFVQWTGDYCGPQDLSNICGAQLPPYLFRGLVSIWPTRLRIYVSHRPTYVVGSYHHICSVDW